MRKTSNKNYWGPEQDELLLKYIKSRSDDDYALIRPAILKIVENVLNTFRLNSYNTESYEDIQSMAEAFICKTLDKLDVNKGKPFSFISLIVKRWLIQQNIKAYNNKNRFSSLNVSINDGGSESAIDNVESPDKDDIFDDYKDELINFYKTNAHLILPLKMRTYVIDYLTHLLTIEFEPKKMGKQGGNKKRANVSSLSEKTGLARAGIYRNFRMLKPLNQVLFQHYNYHKNLDMTPDLIKKLFAVRNEVLPVGNNNK